MATDGSSTSIESPRTPGKGALIPLVVSIGHLGNSEVFKAGLFVPFKCYVRAVYSANGAVTSDPALTITTSETSPQTIVNAVNLATNTFDTPASHTINDAGPLIAGTLLVIDLTCDSGDAIGGCIVTIMVEPVY